MTRFPADGYKIVTAARKPSDNARVLDVLKNPAYAGAYVYGRRRRDPIGRRPGARGLVRTTLAKFLC